MLRTFAIVSNQIVLSFGVFDSFFITKIIQDRREFYRIHGKAIGSSFTWRTQDLKLYSPLPKTNHECKEGNQREKSNMKNSRGQQLLNTFRALSGVHFMHTICRFKSQEVRNPTLQMVHKSELKWRSYSHWKPITPSWRKKFAQHCEITLLLWNDFAAFLHSAVEFLITTKKCYFVDLIIMVLSTFV